LPTASKSNTATASTIKSCVITGNHHGGKVGQTCISCHPTGAYSCPGYVLQ
jgi:hypothetical protein